MFKVRLHKPEGQNKYVGVIIAPEQIAHASDYTLMTKQELLDFIWKLEDSANQLREVWEEMEE